jgi:hypothetical protein
LCQGRDAPYDLPRHAQWLAARGKNAEGEPRLAAASRSSQGEQPNVRKAGEQFVDLTFPANE